MGMLREIFFIFEMWPPLSGGHLHYKLGAIQIRHHGATYVWKLQLFCSCQCAHSVCTCHFHWFDMERFKMSLSLHFRIRRWCVNFALWFVVPSLQREIAEMGSNWLYNSSIVNVLVQTKSYLFVWYCYFQ